MLNCPTCAKPGAHHWRPNPQAFCAICYLRDEAFWPLAPIRPPGYRARAFTRLAIPVPPPDSLLDGTGRQWEWPTIKLPPDNGNDAQTRPPRRRYFGRNPMHAPPGIVTTGAPPWRYRRTTRQFIFATDHWEVVVVDNWTIRRHGRTTTIPEGGQEAFSTTTRWETFYFSDDGWKTIRTERRKHRIIGLWRCPAVHNLDLDDFRHTPLLPSAPRRFSTFTTPGYNEILIPRPAWMPTTPPLCRRAMCRDYFELAPRTVTFCTAPIRSIDHGKLDKWDIADPKVKRAPWIQALAILYPQYPDRQTINPYHLPPLYGAAVTPPRESDNRLAQRAKPAPRLRQINDLDPNSTQYPTPTLTPEARALAVRKIDGVDRWRTFPAIYWAINAANHSAEWPPPQTRPHERTPDELRGWATHFLPLLTTPDPGRRRIRRRQLANWANQQLPLTAAPRNTTFLCPRCRCIYPEYYRARGVCFDCHTDRLFRHMAADVDRAYLARLRDIDEPSKVINPIHARPRNYGLDGKSRLAKRTISATLSDLAPNSVREYILPLPEKDKRIRLRGSEKATPLLLPETPADIASEARAALIPDWKPPHAEDRFTQRRPKSNPPSTPFHVGDIAVVTYGDNEPYPRLPEGAAGEIVRTGKTGDREHPDLLLYFVAINGVEWPISGGCLRLKFRQG